MHAFFSAQTIVVIGPLKDACVYINGQFAYHTERPNERFEAALKKCSMPGQGAYLATDYEIPVADVPKRGNAINP